MHKSPNFSSYYLGGSGREANVGRETGGFSRDTGLTHTRIVEMASLVLILMAYIAADTPETSNAREIKAVCRGIGLGHTRNAPAPGSQL